MSKIFKFLCYFLILIVGIAIGGYLFRNTQPRSLLALDRCSATCLRPKDLAGLLASAGIVNLGAPLPQVVLETDRVVVIKHPIPQAKYHYVILPKKDIKNVADLTSDDMIYVGDAMAVAGELVRNNNLTKYKIISNGPGYQSVTYLHFHLLANS